VKIEITEQEFNTRKSHGTIFICRSCLDNRNKYIMVDYKEEGNCVHYRFCEDCMQMMGECAPCKAKKK
jgi:hypothetical protein